MATITAMDLKRGSIAILWQDRVFTKKEAVAKLRETNLTRNAAEAYLTEFESKKV